jgi:threonine/homoserine/homoserine lactone efflux protein
MTNLYSLLIYVVVTTFTPGPNNILAMSHGVQSGFRRTLGFLTGIFSGFTIVMLICGLLNSLLVGLLPQMQNWLNLAGAIYMAYLGMHTILSKPVENAETNASMNTFTAGFALQFLNLKVILYGITVFSLFITPMFRQPFAIVLSAGLLAGVGFAATTCWALGGSMFRIYWQKHDRLLNWVMGGSLIYLAVHSVFS